jgi:hypothetical protein
MFESQSSLFMYFDVVCELKFVGNLVRVCWPNRIFRQIGKNDWHHPHGHRDELFPANAADQTVGVDSGLFGGANGGPTGHTNHSADDCSRFHCNEQNCHSSLLLLVLFFVSKHALQCHTSAYLCSGYSIYLGQILVGDVDAMCGAVRRGAAHQHGLAVRFAVEAASFQPYNYGLFVLLPEHMS